MSALPLVNISIPRVKVDRIFSSFWYRIWNWYCGPDQFFETTWTRAFCCPI